MIREKFVPILLVISALGSCRQEGSTDISRLNLQDSGFNIIINDTIFKPDDGYFLIPIGKPNQFVIKPIELTQHINKLRVKVIRTLPDGSRIIDIKKFNKKAKSVHFDIGPMSAAPEYEYEAGAVYMKGYQVSVRLEDNRGKNVGGWEFEQGLSNQATSGRTGMADGSPPVKLLRMNLQGKYRQLFDPKFGSMPLFTLRLSSIVLSDQDSVTILTGLNNGDIPLSIDAVLRITNNRGKEIFEKQVNLEKDAPGEKYSIDVRDWPIGDYKVELLPVIKGRIWPDGSAVIYRRQKVDSEALSVSPFANWVLKRDKTREELQITDLRNAHKQWGVGKLNEEHWGWQYLAPDKVSLVSRGDYDIDPVALRLPIKGYYAVYAKVTDVGYFVQIGGKGLIRAIPPVELNDEDVFIAAADISDDTISIYSGSDPDQWIDGTKLKSRGSFFSLRLVPVTQNSVQSFYRELMNPPTPMLCVSDWTEYFGPVWSRLTSDQFESIICAQSEIGWRTIGWSVGRSWIEYHSKLPESSRFPCVSYNEASKVHKFETYDYRRRIKMIKDYDPLKEVFKSQNKCDVEIWPWLGMNRHYGITSYGGMFSSKWFKDNPQWWQWQKNGSSPRGSAVSYYFPEVRKERIDILLEVSRRGAHGLIIGCDRQVPMLLYNPAMVKAYIDKTGVDPQKIDISDGEKYINWIRWRADFFTQFLRELKTGLESLSSPDGKPIKISVRIPSSGILNNLAQGLDIESWLREGLVDILQLDPLEDMGGKGQHDVRPYLELSRQYKVKIFGGIGATAFLPRNGGWSYDSNERGGYNLKHLIPGLKRANGLLKAGIHGIDSYETEMLAFSDPVRFLVAMYGNQTRLEAFLRSSNLEAVAPVDAGNAMSGFDNHSGWHGGWTKEGYGASSL